ncbi:hypothetical protein COU61_03295, partial [Candidatus Pacearchaeota archaeon CG10_big_fil_rev_8_21_14_0_10_35_13]
MPALRKASAYTKRYARPYTRKSKQRRKNYIRAVPGSKIVKIQMGDARGFAEGKYAVTFKLIATEYAQLRSNALESARQGIIKTLEKNLNGQYFFVIKAHPHHVQRENKALTGAGADRLSSGMQLSFGKTVGRAALVKPGKELFVVGVHNTEKARK